MAARRDDGSRRAALGFGEPIICSAENNYHRRDLIDTLYDIVPHTEREGEALSALTEMKLARSSALEKA